jgi:LmbE family N-acetylglucosaminyl deacetylase
VIVAHPDDEIVGLGGQLAQIEPLTLVHVTDGAPRGPGYAPRAGFPTRESYVEARSRGLDRALAAAGVRQARSRELGIAGQEATQHLPELVKVLIVELAQADVVLTHPYEGGHPDHDACAFAVQAACALLGFLGAVAPLRAEFACYHAREGQLRAGHFWDVPGYPERVVALDAPQRERKRAALAELLTHAATNAYPPDIERLRRAPSYDFTRPPPPQDVLYERHGSGMTGTLWREQVRGALQTLGLD